MNKSIIRRTIQVGATLMLQAVLLFIAAGTLKWTWAWIFIVTGIMILLINYLVLPAEVIEERGKKKENVKKWDRILSGINTVPAILIYLLSGLDFRFGWTGPVNMAINISGLTFMFAGAMLFTWGMVSNRFFSTMVRIQEDREHRVATGGPYRYVRHPGYVGYIVMSAATPLALGSYWALTAAGVSVVLIIIRTKLEDDTLKNELEGYPEYAGQVKKRLIPGVW